MQLAELYDKLDSQLTAKQFNVTFAQPSAKTVLPVVQIGPHTDTDMSTKADTLTTIDQQIDFYTEKAEVSVFDFEIMLNSLRASIYKAYPWLTMTTVVSIDDTSGRDLRRGRLMLTYEI
jgi:hypothetical protein